MPLWLRPSFHSQIGDLRGHFATNRSEMRISMKKIDYIIVSGLLVLGVIFTFFIFRPADAEPGALEVRQNGKVIMTLPLSENTTKTIENNSGGTNTFTVRDGAVTMTEADCGDYTCIQTGSITKTGESIVCLPHRLVLQIVSNADSTEPEPDAVVH